MKTQKILSIVRVLLGATFVVALSFDLLLVVQLLIHFATGGLAGVHAWIMHIGSEGRIQMQDGFRLPTKRQVYAGFAGACAFLTFLTLSSWWGYRSLTGKGSTERAQ